MPLMGMVSEPAFARIEREAAAGNAKARELVKRDGVEMKYYDVIYHLTEEIAKEMAGELGPERIENVVGRAAVKEVFRSGKKDKAAGLLVEEGVIPEVLTLVGELLDEDRVVFGGPVPEVVPHRGEGQPRGRTAGPLRRAAPILALVPGLPEWLVEA